MPSRKCPSTKTSPLRDTPYIRWLKVNINLLRFRYFASLFQSRLPYRPRSVGAYLQSMYSVIYSMVSAKCHLKVTFRFIPHCCLFSRYEMWHKSLKEKLKSPLWTYADGVTIVVSKRSNYRHYFHALPSCNRGKKKHQELL